MSIKASWTVGELRSHIMKLTTLLLVGVTVVCIESARIPLGNAPGNSSDQVEEGSIHNEPHSPVGDITANPVPVLAAKTSAPAQETKAALPGDFCIWDPRTWGWPASWHTPSPSSPAVQPEETVANEVAANEPMPIVVNEDDAPVDPKPETPATSTDAFVILPDLELPNGENPLSVASQEAPAHNEEEMSANRNDGAVLEDEEEVVPPEQVNEENSSESEGESSGGDEADVEPSEDDDSLEYGASSRDQFPEAGSSFTNTSVSSSSDVDDYSTEDA